MFPDIIQVFSTFIADYFILYFFFFPSHSVFIFGHEIIIILMPGG